MRVAYGMHNGKQLACEKVVSVGRYKKGRTHHAQRRELYRNGGPDFICRNEMWNYKCTEKLSLIYKRKVSFFFIYIYFKRNEVVSICIHVKSHARR